MFISTVVYPGLLVVSAASWFFPPTPLSCFCLTDQTACAPAQSSGVWNKHRKLLIFVCIFKETNNKKRYKSIPLLHLHHGFLHFVNPLLELHGLCLLLFCLPLWVLGNNTSHVSVLQRPAANHPSTWALWNICRFRVLTWSSWSRKAASVSCFSWMSFSSSFMATSISTFKPTWSSSSRSSSWHTQPQKNNRCGVYCVVYFQYLWLLPQLSSTNGVYKSAFLYFEELNI